jgi:Zn-dependent metalloprotease
MADLATRIVNTAQRLYGNQTANKVQAAFEDRGIL